jgi:hypothetical protein
MTDSIEIRLGALGAGGVADADRLAATEGKVRAALTAGAGGTTRKPAAPPRAGKAGGARHAATSNDATAARNFPSSLLSPDLFAALQLELELRRVRFRR